MFNNYVFMTIILFEFNQYLKYNAGKKISCNLKKIYKWEIKCSQNYNDFFKQTNKKEKIKKTIREVSFEMKGTSNG